MTEEEQQNKQNDRGPRAHTFLYGRLFKLIRFITYKNNLSSHIFIHMLYPL